MPLKNFDQVIDKQARPEFGRPILWNLAGRGIRGMEYSSYHQEYFIIAGAPDEKMGFSLYSWDGKADSQPVHRQSTEMGRENFTPEALMVFDDSPEIILLSDDGSLIVNVAQASECKKGELLNGSRCKNKYLTNPSQKTFRAVELRRH